MKYSIKFKTISFTVSQPLFNAIVETNVNYQIETQKNNKIVTVNDSFIAFFKVVRTTSLTHFYASFSDKKYRINKRFFQFLITTTLSCKLQVSNSRKKCLDKFYTKPNIAQLCVSVFSLSIDVSKHDLIIEPSAGNGSFIKPLADIKCQKIFLDVEPENKKIQKFDFLEWEPPVTCHKIHVIGNPPFGLNNQKAIQFFNHAAKFADTISFILPRTFRRKTIQNRLSLNFRLNHQIELQKKSFVNTDARCDFQIWEKTIIKREKEKLIRRHKDFFFPKPKETPDFYIRSAGNCGSLLLTDFNRVVPGSFHPIKSNIDPNLLITRFQQLDLSSCFDNVGVPHLTQYQLVDLYTKHVEKINSKNATTINITHTTLH